MNASPLARGLALFALLLLCVGCGDRKMRARIAALDDATLARIQGNYQPGSQPAILVAEEIQRRKAAKEGPQRAQGRSSPGGAGGQAEQSSGMAVKSTKVLDEIQSPGVGVNPPQMYQPQANHKFLWVQFEVIKEDLPFKIDLFSVSITAEGKNVSGVLGYDTYSREDGAARVEGMIAMPDTQGHAQMVSIMGHSSNESIESQYELMGSKSASITIKKTPVRFSLVFDIPPELRRVTVRGIGTSEIPVDL